jgi:pyridoxal phosphate enzyme (YggS family)
MTLASRLAAVDERIADAARAVGRDAAGITRKVVTNFHPATHNPELYALGVRDVGENRGQELIAKRQEIVGLDGLRWNFIGQLQSKKARSVRAASDTVHSIDRDKLVSALDAPGEGLLDVLVQVNLTDDAGRGGVSPHGLEALAERIEASSSLRLRGVMAVAPLEEPAASAFERLAGYAERVRAVSPAATWISAGMSHDYAEAIAHGATHLRIGSAITGPRPQQV